MQSLKDAIDLKLLDSAVYNNVSGRCYFESADSDDYPRLVYSFVSLVPERTFSERYINGLVQVDLFFSKSAGSSAMTTAYNNLIALLDECALIITGYTLVWMRETNTVFLSEEVDALPDGTTSVNHVAIDFETRVSLN